MISNQPDPIELSTACRCSPWLSAVAYPLACKVVLPFYFQTITVIGQENIPTDGPVILAPTHRSRWDALILGYAAGRWATGRDLRFMVTSDEVKGLQGWFIRRLGGFPVNPRNPAIASLRCGVDILQNSEMLVIFPEGAIFQDNQLHRLKPGLARLALQAESLRPGLNTKIVPISLHYGAPNVPWGCGVTVRIGQPLSVHEYRHGSAKQSAQHLTQDLDTALRTLDAHSFAIAPSSGGEEGEESLALTHRS
ncbi:MAG TPA: 1-acyl-sn-glycerol-3-phosphate acyltransferase [Chroococcidiopsis sp.]